MFGFRITEVVKHLLILNVLMFLLSNLVGMNALALSYFLSEDFRPFQLATYFFMHGDLGHLFFNMIGLVFFGSTLESVWGPKKFLFYYFFCAIGAAVAHYGIYYIEFAQIQSVINQFGVDPSYDHFAGFFHRYFDALTFTTEGVQAYDAISVQLKAGNSDVVPNATRLMEEVLNANINAPKILGASGAIFGIMLAYGLLFPEREIYLFFLPIGFKAKYFVPVLMIIELQMGVQNFEWDNIAHFAHLGGAIVGALLLLYWEKFGSRFD